MRPGPSRPCDTSKPRPTPEDQVLLGHASVGEADVHVAVRGVVVAVHLHAAQDVDALGAGRHQDLRVTLVPLRLRVGADHDDVDLAARVAGAGGEPLLAVQHPLVAVELGIHGDVGGVGGGDARLGHDEGRADLALQQGLQPLLLVLGRAVALQHLHVAGVGRGAVEGLGRQPRPAHLLGQVGVFDGGQPEALVAGREPEVPQAPLARLGLEAFADLLLTLGVGPAVAALADLGLVLLLQRHDLLADHGAHLLDERLHLGRHAEVHGTSSVSGMRAGCRHKSMRGRRREGIRERSRQRRSAAAPHPQRRLMLPEACDTKAADQIALISEGSLYGHRPDRRPRRHGLS